MSATSTKWLAISTGDRLPLNPQIAISSPLPTQAETVGQEIKKKTKIEKKKTPFLLSHSILQVMRDDAELSTGRNADFNISSAASKV